MLVKTAGTFLVPGTSIQFVEREHDGALFRTHRWNVIHTTDMSGHLGCLLQMSVAVAEGQAGLPRPPCSTMFTTTSVNAFIVSCVRVRKIVFNV